MMIPDDLYKWFQILLAGRKIILTGNVMAVLAGKVPHLLKCNLKDLFILGVGRGTGEWKITGNIKHCSIDFSAPDLFTMMHDQERLLADLPHNILKRLDQFDPGGEAVVLAGSWTQLQHIAGRQVLGTRPPSWAALEDKTKIDTLWEQAGVICAPWENAPPAARDLETAVNELDSGLGTVWTCDAREGISGFSHCVRWVPPGDRQAFDRALAFFTPRCDTIRVMPFLAGIPCSIHSLVLPRTTIVFRPMEQLVFRKLNSCQFLFTGVANSWKPDPRYAQDMRKAALQTGEFLRDNFSYQGAFAIDGIMTAGGFRPTELNSRNSGGFGLIQGIVPEIPFDLVDLALRERVPFQWIPGDFEHYITHAMDNNQRASLRLVVPAIPARSQKMSLVFKQGNWQKCSRKEEPDGTLQTGCCPAGGFYALTPVPGKLAAGKTFAPSALKAIRFMEQEFGFSTGRLDFVH